MQDAGKQIKESTCPYCGVGCGIDVTVSNNSHGTTLLALEGNKQHPANNGRLCVKGKSLLETTQLEGRLTQPSINGDNTSWDNALDWVSHKLSSTIAEHGSDAVAFYVSGQLLTEDYYVANKLMKGFIGSANIDTNSRLCMSSAVAAYKRAFGEDLVPCCYEDLEKTDLLILIGSNAAWTHPVLFQRIERAKSVNPHMTIVQIDPRKTASSSIVDLHLPLKPGTDAALFNGLLAYIAQHGLNKEYINSYTDGFDAALKSAQPYTPDSVAQICDIDVSKIQAFYKLFVFSHSALSFYSMGINQSTSGVDKANAIINCHLATGKIGKTGCGPFSITGQPNAMGGREVGGLSNMLAAHMALENPQHRQWVSEFWQTNNLAGKAGLSAVDLFEALKHNKVKFVWIMGTNPIASMPNRADIEAALAKCDAVVVSDVVQTNDTLKYANVALPATPWSEKDGTVTNSERVISRQRALQKPSGEAKHDWQIICEVAKRLGFKDAFSFTTAHQIFAEHAALSAFKNGGERAFNLAPLASITPAEYDSLSPIQWPIIDNGELEGQGQKRLFKNGKFFTRNTRAQFIAITPRLPAQLTSPAFPYVLNTGRMRDQWHTMTRTGNATRLHQHTPTAYLYIHPKDAEHLQLKEHDLVKLSANTISSKGQCKDSQAVILPIRFDKDLRQKEVFAPIHWTKQWTSNATIASLFTSDTDPISRQPELKHAAINIEKFSVANQAVLATKIALSKTLLKSIADYWYITKQENCYVYRLAIFAEQIDWLEKFKHISGEQHIFYEHKHTHNQSQTCAAYTANASKNVFEHKLSWVVRLNQHNPTTQYSWLNSLFIEPATNNELSSIIRFEPSTEFLQGEIICSCHKVRELPIKQAIENGITSVDGLGDALKCGTNCGSCKSELANLIETAGISPITKPPQNSSFLNNTLIPINNVEVN